ncbi:SRPBCC domain-containing protein [Luteolibacter sp. SL250]|uniref:SRPBCC domain-containing protein n=1 Tax=Luteolibacter sp. SL250 TaxID=2995170 RepID=UPI00226D9F78|nr:SRPBCC domain-containing protein [Luteolibacter sp. SL250]WAC18023.1 SRPBCC domain-containing protein [Luteolibacter sp. SL250]
MSAEGIHSSRSFAVSRERLYAAFADPEQVAIWWGPAGFTNTIQEFDLRPGGHWRFTMHGPDGQTYEQDKTFTELIPNEKVALRHHGPVHGFLMEISFHDEGAGSRFDWLMRFDDPAEEANLRSFITKANEENFDRLQSHLNSHSA